MGNRAIITFSKDKSAKCVYVHWNGGEASILGFTQAAKKLGFNFADPKKADESAYKLKSVISNYIKPSIELMEDAYRLGLDNGIYVLDEHLNIKEQISVPAYYRPERSERKTQDISEYITSVAPHF